MVDRICEVLSHERLMKLWRMTVVNGQKRKHGRCKNKYNLNILNDRTCRYSSRQQQVSRTKLYLFKDTRKVPSCRCGDFPSPFAQMPISPQYSVAPLQVSYTPAMHARRHSPNIDRPTTTYLMYATDLRDAVFLLRLAYNRPRSRSIPGLVALHC